MNRSICIALIPPTLLSLSSLASAGVQIESSFRKNMVNYTSIAPQSSGYEEQLNKQYGYWSDSLLLSDPKPHFGGSGSASQTSEVLPAANKAGATTLFTGSGGALAHTDDHGVDLVSSYSVTKSNISFKSDQAFTWSMEYLLETDGGGAKSGSAESRIYIIDTNASKVVHEFGGFFDIQDQMPSMNWNGTASGSLPPGSYRLCIMAIANVNKNQEAGGAGLTTAKAYWKADFSVKTYPPYHFKQYEEFQEPLDPGIVFEDVLVNLGRTQQDPHADVNRDGRVDVEDVIESLDMLLNQSNGDSSRRQPAEGPSMESFNRDRRTQLGSRR